MSDLPEKTVEAIGFALVAPGSIREMASGENYQMHLAKAAIIASQDPALGPDRLVVAGPYEELLERATALAERYGEAIVAISAALPNEILVRRIICGLDTEVSS